MFGTLKVLKNTVTITAVLLVITVVCPKLMAEDGQGEYKPPPYQVLRYTEHWSALAERDPAAVGDLFDPVKYISLNRDGSVWMSLGGQVRERVELWDNFNFGAPSAADDNDVYLLTRLFLHTDLHVGEYVRAFVQGKSLFSTDRDLVGGRRTTDVDELALHNGFIDLALPLSGDDTFTLRSGRQELLFGKERLVSPLDWANTRRTFDGFSGTFETDRGKVTGFWTRPVRGRKYDHNKTNNDVKFYGVYGTTKIPSTDVGLDVYWLGIERDGAMFNDSAGNEDRHTVGGRIWGNIPACPVDYDLEGAYQFGEVGSADIDAFMVACQLGCTFADTPATPRMHLAFDYASGDDSEGDGDVETFSHLFPLGHAYLGFIDAVGRQNIIDLSVGLSFKPIDKCTVALTDHNFWRADDDDGLYNAGAKLSRAGADGSSSEVGNELDLTVKYQLDRHAMVLLGYSHFWAGDFIEQSGPDEDVDFAYMALQYTF